MSTTFRHTTVYQLSFAGRMFFYFFANGIETALTEVEFSRLVAAGARVVDVTPA